VKQPTASAPKGAAVIEHRLYHKDGTLWARGQHADGVATGYWEWFRKDGTKLRCGHFVAGEQAGVWTTYDKTGAVYKATTIKPKSAAKLKAAAKPKVRSKPTRSGTGTVRASTAR
jgi:antitoxin component YwqK of YwqJK toxin-antitoxin module